MSDRELRVASKGIKKTKRPSQQKTGVRFLKSRGQHILKNPLILQAIVDKAGIKNTDTVLEVGPGTGNLTVKLLEKAKKVIAVEVDSRLLLELQRRVQHTEAASKLEVIHADVLKTDLPYFDLCVANIPYNIASPLIFKLLAHRPMFRSATILLQREFAMRMVSSPGESNYCRLAVNVELLARAFHLMKIGRNNFVPPPKVDSSLVRIEPRNQLPSINFTEWDNLIKICFQRKNKTLSALFRHRKLLKSLEANYNCFSALQLGKESDPTPQKLATEFDGRVNDISSDDEDIEMKDVCSESFKDRVIQVLKDLQFEDKRPVKMHYMEFMTLLAAFQSAGIHFAA